MTKRKLHIEDLEQRIAPSFVFADGSAPADAGADPVGGQGDYEESFGPDSNQHPNLNAWTAHGDRPTNEGMAHEHTPLDNGGNN